jgi:hypothetical protein
MQYNIIDDDGNVILSGDNEQAAIEIQEALWAYAWIDIKVEEKDE